ncbi:unnamed protein product [Vicia faba]|uniref:Uncharacterized protein n=1 Tax=Vicia faba TaxID=3906 RepID=A0AAV1BD79_VICFA|nr:unnamed protein product [Vicia faba]
MKHGYPPGYKYKSHKSSVNNAIASPSLKAPLDSASDPSPSLAIIQSQYNQILQMLQHQHSSASAPTTSDATPLPNINYVYPLLDGKPHVYWVQVLLITSLRIYAIFTFIVMFPMKLPDGTTVKSDIVGTVHPSNSLTLSNVEKVLLPLDLVLPAKAPALAPTPGKGFPKAGKTNSSAVDHGSSASSDDSDGKVLPEEASKAGAMVMWVNLVVFGMALVGGVVL